MTSMKVGKLEPSSRIEGPLESLWWPSSEDELAVCLAGGDCERTHRRRLMTND